MKESGDGESHQIKVHIPEINIPEIHIPEIDVKIEKAHAKGQHRAVIVHADELDEVWSLAGSFLTIAFVLLSGGVLCFLYLRTKRQPEPQPVEDIDARISTFEKRVDDLQDILLSIDTRIDRRLRKT